MRVTTSIERADEPGRGERQDPGEDDVPGDAPADGGEAACVAPAPTTRAGDRLRRRDREAEVRGRPEDRGARGLRGEALRRVDLRDPRSQRPDDPPAAGVGAERHRESPTQTITQIGTSNSSALRCPVATSASVMIPIVFCASFVPCVNATKPPETSWRAPEDAVHLARASAARTSQMIAIISAKAIAKPERTARAATGLTTFSQMPAPVDDVRGRRPRSQRRRCRRSARGSSSTAGRGTR